LRQQLGEGMAILCLRFRLCRPNAPPWNGVHERRLWKLTDLSVPTREVGPTVTTVYPRPCFSHRRS
jgi:hypothetical protein